MLLLMYYMIIIPLYRMLETTLTWQMRDLIGVPGAELGGFTLFHYARMVMGELSKIYLYTPLQHSLTIATGATLLALVIGRTLAWLVIRTDMPGRKIVNQLALIPYIMPSWTLAQAFRRSSNTWWDKARLMGCPMDPCRSLFAARCITTRSFSCLSRRR